MVIGLLFDLYRRRLARSGASRLNAAGGPGYNAAMNTSTTGAAPTGATTTLTSTTNLLDPLPNPLPEGLTETDAVGITTAMTAAHAESTRTVYASLWRGWERWCTNRGATALPADPAALAAYLVERAADGIAVITLELACSAIRHVHRAHGLPNPANH